MNEFRQHSVMQTLHRFHHFSRKSISTVAQCQLRASHVSARFFKVYLLNTLSTSHDIDEIENSSNAIRANVGYTISFAFHHAMRSNVQFASRPTKVSFGSFKYRSNSSCTSSSAPNRNAIMWQITCNGARRLDFWLRNELLLGLHCQRRRQLWMCGRGR